VSDPTILERVLADPPAVHPMEDGLGVWSTDEDCYRFLAGLVEPGTRTLETGCGTSTVLLAALGAQHICVTPGPEERDRLLAHGASRGIPIDAVRFEVASSHDALPRLAADGVALDVVLVDGAHGFPLPIIDWFYAGSMLRRGGVLIVDDITLPAVRMLVGVLDRDPRWGQVARTAKWAAWRRGTEGWLAEDWMTQPHLLRRAERAKHLGRRITGRARRELGQRLRRRTP
jgi:predicted O-methyltransferase YrrM